MRVRATIAAMLIAIAAHLVLTGPADAHATLVSSEPADGAVVQAAPSRLILTFNEPVSPLVLRLVAPDTTSTVLHATAERGSSLTVSLPSPLREGTHVLSWRVVSLDGHPVGGTIVFSIGAPNASPSLAAQGASDPVASATLWAFKVVLYIGLFIGIGGSFFLAWLVPGLPGGGHVLIVIALVAGLVAVPVLVGLQGADALALPPAGLASGAAWTTGFGTSFGATAIAAAVALLAGFLALKSPTTKIARELSLFGIAAAGLALALSGHASSAPPQWLTRPAVFIHAASLMFWIGALVPLGVILLKEPSSEAVLGRFSRAIPWAVAALVGSGAFLAIVQVADPGALLTTAYGLILCAKLCLVVLLLALAAWNRFRLTPAVMSGSNDARRKLSGSTTLEVAIVLVILGLVAAWRFTPPPRALAAASAKPAVVHIHSAAAMAEVTFEPGRAGLVQARIAIMTGEFGRLDAREVSLTLENRAAGIEAISRPATKESDGIWHVEKLLIPSGGRWSVQVDILINDFEKVTLEGQVDIRPPARLHHVEIDRARQPVDLGEPLAQAVGGHAAATIAIDLLVQRIHAV